MAAQSGKREPFFRDEMIEIKVKIPKKHWNKIKKLSKENDRAAAAELRIILKKAL